MTKPKSAVVEKALIEAVHLLREYHDGDYLFVIYPRRKLLALDRKTHKVLHKLECIK